MKIKKQPNINWNEIVGFFGKTQSQDWTPSNVYMVSTS